MSKSPILQVLRMRIKGSGWGPDSTPDFHISWSFNNTTRPVTELVDHLCHIIRTERKYSAPLEPIVHLPQRPKILGTATEDYADLDVKFWKGEKNVRKDAMTLRETQEA